MTGARTSEDALKKQKPSRSNGNKKDKKRWCKGKPGRAHDYHVGLPTWAKSGPYREWTCEPWDVVNGPARWYCRHILVCSKCGRNEILPYEECPDLPRNLEEMVVWDRHR